MGDAQSENTEGASGTSVQFVHAQSWETKNTEHACRGEEEKEKDKYDIFEETNKNTLNNNFNNKQYALNDNEGEIIKKIKEIMDELSDEDLNKLLVGENTIQENENNKEDIKNLQKDLQKAKAVELFDLIKEKLFDNIKVNYNFEDDINTNAELEKIDADLLNEKYKSKIISWL